MCPLCIRATSSSEPVRCRPPSATTTATSAVAITVGISLRLTATLPATLPQVQVEFVQGASEDGDNQYFVSLVFGVKMVDNGNKWDPSDFGPSEFTDGFDPSTRAAQIFLQGLCYAARNSAWYSWADNVQPDGRHQVSSRRDLACPRRSPAPCTHAVRRSEGGYASLDCEGGHALLESRPVGRHPFRTGRHHPACPPCMPKTRVHMPAARPP